jgi:hypothetical protein
LEDRERDRRVMVKLKSEQMTYDSKRWIELRKGSYGRPGKGWEDISKK